MPSDALADDFNSSQNASVTYARDVAPILFENCSECHRPGQIGPMSLLNYKETRPWARSIKKSVVAKTMPPWFSDDAPGTFSNEHTLTDKEIATIAGWVDQGAKLGDPNDLPAAPEFVDGAWGIGTPDQIFTMVESFEVSDDLEDYYHHTSIPADFEQDRWFKAVELHPGDRSVVHHILVFSHPAGQFEESTFDSDMNLLAKFAPGNNPDIFLPGHGKKIPAGHDLVFQVHYHKEPGPGTGTLDKSSMGVVYADGPVEHPVTTAWLVNPKIELAPGDSDYELRSTFRFIDNGTIYAMGPHMHLRGTKARFVAEYTDGTKETLLNVPSYDFNWQMNYYLAEPKHIPRGTKVRFYASYDNSADNPFNPDPAAAVSWGDATTDEMMIGYMDYTYEKRKKYQRRIALPEGMLLSEAGWGDDHNHNRHNKN